MILEQLQLLFTLYRRPVKAASRIIDTGRLWFALCVALLVSAALGFASFPGAPLLTLGPTAAIKVIAVLALLFVPAVVLVMTLYRSHESFPVMLRKDYLSLLNCVLLSLAAAYLPVAAINFVLPASPMRLLWMLGLIAAGQIYFLVLVTFCVRTLWGTGMVAAAGAAVVGSAATVAGLVGFVLLGSGAYYFSSPFFLYYAYILLGSDVRALGDGFRARQHLRRQLDIATHNPRDADAHYQLGLIYQQRRQYDEAKQRFARAIEIDPREADPVFQLGRIALIEERWDDAIELLNRAAALDDKCCSHEVWRELGVAYLHAARLEEARLALGKYVERRPYDPEGLYWYGKALAYSGACGEARQSFESCREAVETMPPNRRRQLSRWKRMANAELRGLEKPAAVR